MNNYKIYLAGGMSNLSWEEQTTWREVVEELLNQKNIYTDCYKYKLDIINPTTFYNFKEKKWDSQIEIMKYDIRHVKTSNLIIVNYNEILYNLSK
jgi:hypothetical protein